MTKAGSNDWGRGGCLSDFRVRLEVGLSPPSQHHSSPISAGSNSISQITDGQNLAAVHAGREESRDVNVKMKIKVAEFWKVPGTTPRKPVSVRGCSRVVRDGADRSPAGVDGGRRRAATVLVLGIDSQRFSHSLQTLKDPRCRVALLAGLLFIEMEEPVDSGVKRSPLEGHIRLKDRSFGQSPTSRIMGRE